MRTKTLYIITIVLSLLVGVFGTVMVINYIPNSSEVIKEVKEITIKEQNTIKPAIDKIYDAVVLIESYKGNKLVSTGTGFVYKKDDKFGYVITNDHVIDGATKIKVLNITGENFEAKLLGSDKYADIAVLSINEKNVLKVAEIGESTQSEIGDTLFTVGSPVGVEYMGTVTRGILSGKDRTISVTLPHGVFMLDVLQTDAAINPGNSGGPLVNINGQVIGVNSLKLVKDEIEGMGFAIPIEVVMSTVDRLENGEEIKRPYIGVAAVDASDTYDLYINEIYLDKDFEFGIALAEVEENYPAHKSGLKIGDVILEVDNVKVTGLAHFRFLLYKYKINDTISIKYYRDGKIENVKILLDKSIDDA